MNGLATFNDMPEITKHANQQPLLLQSQTFNEKLNENRPFVGIVKCIFENIDLNSEETKREAVIQLSNAKLHVQETKFKNISNGDIIALFACHMSVIESSTFAENNETNGIYLNYCNDITLKSTSFTGCNGSTPNSTMVTVDKSQFVLFDSVSFENIQSRASPVVVADSKEVVFNKVIFSNNRIETPGQIFGFYSKVTVQNSQFLDNVDASHSAALLFIYGKTTIANCLFRNNVIVNFANIPSEAMDLPIYQVAAAVTIVESIQVGTKSGYATTLKNLYFDGSNHSQDFDDDFSSYFYIQAYDVFYQGNALKVVGSIISTGEDMFQYYITGLGDYENFYIEAEELPWSEDVQENLAYVVDYQYQPTLPSLVDISQAFSYLGETRIKATGKYGFVTIKNCEFEDSYVLGNGSFNENTSVIHIDLNNGGYVSVDHTSFSKCKTYFAVLEVINAKGISVVDCSFTRNIAALTSAILIADVPKVRICHTSFEKNYAFLAGALTLCRVDDALIINSKFRKNSGMSGSSAIVIENSTVSINGTQFVRNSNDVMHSIVSKNNVLMEENETILLPATSHGIKIHNIFSSTLSAYGKSSITLGNVAFNDNEEESGLGPQFSNLTSYDGYAEESVKIAVEDSCTDNKRMNFNYNWSTNLKYNARKCDLNKVYDYREYFVPTTKTYTTTDFEKNNAVYVLKEVQKTAVIYEVENRIDSVTNLTRAIPPPRPTAYPVPPAIKEGLAPYKTVLITVGSICFVVLVIGVALIYKYRKKPENRLKKKTPEQKAVMDGLINKNEDSEYQSQIDEPPSIETQQV